MNITNLKETPVALQEQEAHSGMYLKLLSDISEQDLSVSELLNDKNSKMLLTLRSLSSLIALVPF